MSSAGNENAPEETYTYTAGRGVTKRPRVQGPNDTSNEEDGGAMDFFERTRSR